MKQCLSQWSKVSEDPYRIHNEVSENGEKSTTVNGSPFDGIDGNAPLSSSDEEATLTEEEADIPNGFDAGAETDVDDEEQSSELAKYMPTISREDSSPHEETNEDWEGMNDELADFLGSEADDDSESEAESTRSKESTDADEDTPSAKKRKREDEGLTSDSDVSQSGSRLQKRKRKALARTTSLASMAAVTSLPNQEPFDLEADAGDVVNGDDGEDEEDEDDDAALEAELEAEMLRQAEEEDSEEGDE